MRLQLRLPLRRRGVALLLIAAALALLQPCVLADDTWVPVDSGAGTFIPAAPLRVQLPQENWRADSAAPLPPPPGWTAAEFASLGRTMGSSPESEPLLPGDELTMETGRIASHKDGFFQKYSISSAWIPRDGSDDLGLIETKTYLTVAVPLPSRDYPMLITTGFDVCSLSGPDTPSLPAELFDAYLDFMWLPKLTERWLGILAISPGVYSDFDSMQADAFRIKGKALARFDWAADRLQILFGILYLNRHDVNWLPAGGIIWNPTDDVSLECVFPRPKFGYRFTASELFEDWIYLAGEFGGDTWSIRRGPDFFDMMTYVDWRIYLGVERRQPGGGSYRLEAGYIFSREVQFDSPTPDFTAANTFMIRGGLDF